MIELDEFCLINMIHNWLSKQTEFVYLENSASKCKVAQSSYVHDKLIVNKVGVYHDCHLTVEVKGKLIWLRFIQSKHQ